jgi:DNA invertase Pin-like site-specific DNA recombinase
LSAVERSDRFGIAVSETAWIFAAVSSDPQSSTLEDQENWARGVATEKGWQILRTFSGTASGKAGPRKLLRTLLAELRTTDNPPHVILMNRLDRVGRGRMVESQVALSEITERGIKVFTREQGFVANETWQDEMINAVRFAVARGENEAKADRIKAGYESKRRKGLFVGNVPPYGTRIKDGLLVAKEPQAAIVREVFKLRLAGLGYLTIGRRMAKKAPPKERKDGSTRNISWHRTFVRFMLRCVSYRGTVVNCDLWDKVQLIKNPDFKLHAKRKWPWPLRGAVRCAECGYALTGSTPGSKTCRIRYYVCLSPQHERGFCHRADALEEQFAELLDRLVASPELIARYRRHPKESEKSLRSRLAELERLSERAEKRKAKTWEMVDDPAFDKGDLAKRLNVLGAEMGRLQTKIASVNGLIAAHSQVVSIRADASALLSKARAVWERSGTERRQNIAQAVSRALGGLYVGKTGRIVRRGTVSVDGESWKQYRTGYRRDPSGS